MNYVPTPQRSRHRRRARQHEAAHGGGGEAAAAVEHPRVARAEPRLVQTATELAGLVERLRAAGAFAFDSEFIGELTYYPRLCLIQAATAGEIGLIDPLAGLDVRPFWELVADPGVEKIVHAGQQDAEPAYRTLGRPAANLFDTQIAGGMIGWGYPLSLSKLVYLHFRVRLNKTMTLTDWSRRPLSEMQLRYAADDVRFLPAIRHEMGERLQKLGHMDWAREESNALGEAGRADYDAEAQARRLRGSAALPPRHQAVLRALLELREQAARTADVPARAWMKDELLLELARTPVNSAAGLREYRGLPRQLEALHGEAIVAATRAAMASDARTTPGGHAHEPPPPEKFGEDALLIAAQALCAGQRLDPGLVLNRAEAADLYRRFLDREPTDTLRLMQGWRREAAGDALLALLEGRRGFGLEWADGCLQLKR